MEIWIILVMVLAVVLGAGGWASVAALQRHQLHGRQDRWRALEGRFNQVTLDADRYERSPGDALAAPGWLDRSSPVVRGFSGTLKRAQRDRAELERSVAPAPGRAGREITSGSRDPASGLNPTEADLQEFELLVERLEDAYRDADRAVRSTGWSNPGALRVPHPQFLLDPRWGQAAVLPRLGSLDKDPKAAERSVKEFLDAAYPLRRETALKALRERSGGASNAYRAQKALDRVIQTRRYTVDRHGFLWPSATVVEYWGVYRTFGRGADLQAQDIPPVEVANALWFLLPEDRGMPDEELLRLAQEHLALTPGFASGLTQTLNEGIARGLKSLPENVRRTLGEVAPNGVQLPAAKPRIHQLLAEGLHEGLITGRLQRQPDGLVRRLRVQWPSTYRR
ncbi:hypothetical protein [Citricoccus sp. I39-566]|uniref:hypothetical protein n=1 Tax=Citricoccus sp. I39-566 TaxID=3073268 RepID=UPI00286A27B2|nr:hypothetical protein [Citricoccus sp. I39-566]WMY79765.1 hypothetical protein RE421_07955 [Citricoccus sp. I39-566]